jgi:outer membrane protein TolC
MTRPLVCALIVTIAGARGTARAQPAAPQGEVLQLAALQREALALDPRLREAALQSKQTDLRVRNMEVERYPSISALGLVQYQSDVPVPPPFVPGGRPLFIPPKDTYDLSVRVDQRLFDPAIGPRIDLARADLAESQARVRVAMFTLREEVNEAFFSAALFQEQIAALGATLADLEARLRETNIRVREGAALAADAAAIEATLLQQRQQDDELRANRAAALARLEGLTGRTIGTDAVLSMPALADLVADARSRLGALRARPEYEQFDRARDRAVRQQDVSAAAERPQVTAFGRAGYGKPGLNFINDGFDTYALAGIQLQWKTWTWGATGREKQALALQRDVVTAEEAAFTARLRRAIETDAATVDRLLRVLDTDDAIIALRASVDRTSRVRFQEGAVTASESLDRTTDWLNARFAQARHRVELAHAQAHLLTTLGLEVR